MKTNRMTALKSKSGAAFKAAWLAVRDTLCGRSPYTPAIGAGALLWLLAGAVGSGREAWSSGFYWVLAYPLSVATAGFLGYLYPERAWRWGLAVILAQAAMHAIAAFGRGFLPTGSALFALLAVPSVGVAMIAARLRLAAESDPGLR